MNLHQETVPIHSTDRLDPGEKWSSKVGSADIRPERDEYGYQPPEGIHPYEQRAQREELKGAQFQPQQTLPDFNENYRAAQMQYHDNWMKRQGVEPEDF